MKHFVLTIPQMPEFRNGKWTGPFFKEERVLLREVVLGFAWAAGIEFNMPICSSMTVFGWKQNPMLRDVTSSDVSHVLAELAQERLLEEAPDTGWRPPLDESRRPGGGRPKFYRITRRGEQCLLGKMVADSARDGQPVLPFVAKRLSEILRA